VNRPDKELNGSLNRLSNNRDFMDFVKALDDSLNSQLRLNVRFVGEEGTRGQGKAEELIEILDFIKAAPQQILNQTQNKVNREFV
jgi:hypothetical protein